DSYGDTSWHHAFLRKNTETVILLIGNGADHTVEGTSGLTLIDTAAMLYSMEIVELFLDKDMSVGGATSTAWTPLVLTYQPGSFGMCRSFIDTGADINPLRLGCAFTCSIST
ncbi:ankyrin repeat-containing domain protein, partial [Fusarium oxysporum f. sp. albedinis]